MAVNLSRSNNATIGPETAVSLSAHIAARVFDSYCSAGQYQSFVKHGVAETESTQKSIENAVDLELEHLGAANEHRLLEELDAALYRFTSADRKLQPKEETDAMQLVCKPRPGFRFGLRTDVAAAAIVSYCRTNSIKKKSGLFSWSIP